MRALFWERVTPGMRSILAGFTQSELGARFYLAGDTAPAPKLLLLMSWQQVKAYFIGTCKEIASDWLA